MFLVLVPLNTRTLNSVPSTTTRYSHMGVSFFARSLQKNSINTCWFPFEAQTRAANSKKDAGTHGEPSFRRHTSG